MRLTYMLHMAIAVPMLVVEVPFGKWAHLLYRPLGMYVAEVKRGTMRCREAAAVDRLPPNLWQRRLPARVAGELKVTGELRKEIMSRNAPQGGYQEE